MSSRRSKTENARYKGSTPSLANSALQSWPKARVRSATPTRNSRARLIPRTTNRSVSRSTMRLPTLAPAGVTLRSDRSSNIDLREPLEIQGMSPSQKAGSVVLGVPPENHLAVEPSLTTSHLSGIGPSSESVKSTSACPGKRKRTNHSRYSDRARSSSSSIRRSLISMSSSKAERTAATRCWVARGGSSRLIRRWSRRLM